MNPYDGETKPLDEIGYLTGRPQSPPPPRRKASIKRCAVISCCIVTLLVLATIVWAIGSVTRVFYKQLSDPHRELFYNGTANPSTLGATVVRPLIDHDTLYDVAVSVYVRRPDPPTTATENGQIDLPLDSTAQKQAREEEHTASILKIPVSEVRAWAPEDLLWSGYIARAQTLSSRPINTVISFDLPLDRFYDDKLYARDLRLGVAVIPRSPSKLDRVEDYTYWKGNISRQYHCAMDERLYNDAQLAPSPVVNQTVHTEVLQHMTTSYSLLEFVDVPYCNSTNSTSSVDEEEEDLYGSVDYEDQSTELKEDKPSRHPFIIKRSHFYLVNETRLLDRKQFDKKHSDLRKHSCGRSLVGTAPSWMLCDRNYHANGQWDLRLGLYPAQEGGKKELAYGTYVGRLQNSAGPKDVQKLPVTRGECNGIALDRSSDPTSLHVDHNMRFSILSPRRLQILEQFTESVRPAHNATQGEVHHAHDHWQQISGLFGDRSEGAHPWTRFTLSLVDGIAEFALTILSILYWYTRTSSTGINHLATTLHAVGWAASVLTSTVYVFHVGGIGAGLIQILFGGWPLIVCLCMLRLVCPFQLESWSLKRFKWRRTQWTHRERRSIRTGHTISWTITISLLLASWAIIYLPDKYNLYVISPRSVFTDPSIEKKWYASSWVYALEYAPQVVGLALQLEHNRRSETFAGDYALAAFIRLANRFIELLWWTPMVGTYDARQALTYVMAMRVGIDIWTGYQAWTLPREEQEVDEVEQ